MAKIVGQLKAILGLDKSRFDQGLNQAEKKTNSFGNAMKKIGGILAAAFSVAAIISFTKKIITFSKEAMNMAAEVEGIKNAYTKFGIEGQRVLTDIKKATRGVISEDELMALAIKAHSLGIPFKDLAIYLAFATNQAIRLGKPIQEFADLMITAIGRGQGRGLVQMGLSLKESTAAFRDTNGPLSYFVKKLEEMGPVADTTAIKMQRLKVSGTELKEAWGTWLNKADAPNIFRTYYTDLFNVWADETKTFAQKANAYLRTFGIQLGEKTIWRSGQRKTKKEREAEAELTLSPDYWKSIERYLQNQKKPKDDDDTVVTGNAIGDLIKKINEEATAANNLAEAWKRVHEEMSKKAGITGLAPIDISNLKIPMLSTKPILPGLQPFGATKPSDMEISRREIEQTTEELQKQQVAVDILSNAFDTLFTSTEDGFKAMIDSIITSINRLIAELISRVVILTILNILTEGGASFATILKNAAGSMGFAKGVEGLTVPSGYPHDTFPAMLTSGETVLTAEESRNFNRSININVKGEISGRAIALVGRRTEREN